MERSFPGIKLLCGVTAAAVCDSHVCIMDLNKLQVRLFQGTLPRYFKEFDVDKEQNTLVTLTMDRLGIKLYDMATCLVKHIVPGKLGLVKLNWNGTVAVAEHEDGETPPLIFDLITKACIRKIMKSGPTEIQGVDEMIPVHDPRYAVVLMNTDVYTDPTEPSTGEGGDYISVVHYGLLDVQNGEIVTKYLDEDTVRANQKQYTGSTVEYDVYDGTLLTQDLLIATHNDRKVRLWDIQSGKQVAELCDHPTYVSRRAASQDTPPSHVITVSDLTIKLWETKAWECKASFTLDEQPKHECLPGDGSSVMLIKREENKLMWLGMAGEVLTPPMDYSKYPTLFDKPRLDCQFEIHEAPCLSDPDQGEDDEEDEDDDEDSIQTEASEDDEASL